MIIDDGDYLSETLLELRNEDLEKALSFFDEKSYDKIDFWEETHADDPINIKEENAKIIRELFQLANQAPTNLRYGDGSSNSAIQEHFDPLGDKNGNMTRKETEMLENWVVSSSVIKPKNSNNYYIRSSTGFYEFDNQWYIKCKENNSNCY